MKLKEIMELNDITAEELSVIIKVSARQIYRWMSGEAEIRSSNLLSLANYFQCSTDYLLAHDGGAQQSTLAPLEITLLHAFRKLTDIDKNKVVGIVQAFSC